MRKLISKKDKTLLSRKQRNILVIAIVVSVAIAPAVVAMMIRNQLIHESVVHLPDTTEVVEITYEYGIPTNDYEITYGIVEKNQSLSTILREHGLGITDVHKLTEKAKGTFDERKVRSGQAYAVFYSKDSIPQAKYFIYEESPRGYLVFDLNGDYSVNRVEYPVEWRTKTAKGKVSTSLWFAMDEIGASPMLAVTLSNIFGWTIDFFGLKKDDEFRVIYEQEYVNGRKLDSFYVKAASFKQGDSTYYAIPFIQDGEELYYNVDGNSLKGAFLKAPLDFYRITSRFTNSRFHPVLKRYRAHHGIDYAAPVGTPVYAVADGVVIAKAYQASGAGYYIKIRHSNKYETTYMHLSRFAKDIKKGSKVKQKQVIGYVGSTGLSTGPHLDFRVHLNGKPINPLSIKSPPDKPISNDNREAFYALCDSLVQQLNEL